jgi:hypothetical protein
MIMEPTLINALGTIGFGGGVAVVIAYIAFRQFETQSKNHKETVEKICESHRVNFKRTCASFDRALDRRDKDIEILVSEVRTLRSGINPNASGIING